jgi:hypothetical protein
MGFFDFGRKFINGLPGVGGITSNLWGDPSQEGVQDAYKKAQQEQAMQRMNMMDSRMNAMNQGALAFGPRNQMLGQMMGQQGPAMDMTQMLQNPMSQGMQNGIRQAAFGTAPPNDGRPVGGQFVPPNPNSPPPMPPPGQPRRY